MRGKRISNRAHGIKLVLYDSWIGTFLRSLKKHMFQKMRNAPFFFRFIVRSCRAHHQNRHGIRAFHWSSQNPQSVFKFDFFKHELLT